MPIPLSLSRLRRPVLACATALALTAPVATPAAAFDPAAMTEAERSALRAEIRAFLLDHPEVMLEVFEVLEQRQYQDQVNQDLVLLRDHAAEIFEDPASWAGGNLEGDVTVVEFIDYRCGYCRQAHDEVAELVESDGNIRLVLKEFPILGEQSLIFSRFAVAVLQRHGDAAYKAVHDVLMTQQGAPSPQLLRQIARDQGLDPDPILAHMDSPEVTQVIAANRALAERLEINGTPTFVFSEAMVRGYVPLEGMERIVAQHRAE